MKEDKISKTIKARNCFPMCSTDVRFIKMIEWDGATVI